MSVRKKFCEVTDFAGDTIALTRAQAWHVVRIYRSTNTRGVSMGTLRACLDESVGVVLRDKHTTSWWVVAPRDVASIERLLGRATP